MDQRVQLDEHSLEADARVELDDERIEWCLQQLAAMHSFLDEKRHLDYRLNTLKQFSRRVVEWEGGRGESGLVVRVRGVCSHGGGEADVEPVRGVGGEVAESGCAGDWREGGVRETESSC